MSDGAREQVLAVSCPVLVAAYGRAPTSLIIAALSARPGEEAATVEERRTDHSTEARGGGHAAKA